MPKSPVLMITGASGFVGTTLLAMAKAGEVGDWQLALPPEGFDVCCREHWDQALEVCAPQAVLHLAAQSHVPSAFAQPARTLEVNVLGTAHALEALRARRFEGRFLYVSSADVYGLVPEAQLPITEEQPAAPRNPYAVSKLSAEWLCRQFALTEGLQACIARPFNHSGAGQSDAFALPGFARQVAAIAQGRQAPVIQVGDVDVTRDFTPVRDVLRAYLRLLEVGVAGEIYNVCSGRELRLRDALEQMLAMAGVQAELQVDQARLRRAEQRRVCGSAAKLQQLAGWQPAGSHDALLREILTDWMTRKPT